MLYWRISYYTVQDNVLMYQRMSCCTEECPAVQRTSCYKGECSPVLENDMIGYTGE